MSTTRFLSASTRTALLADLAGFGFIFTDENGDTRIPEPMDVIQHGQDACIWIGHIPAKYSYDPITQESTIIKPASTDWCANVTSCEGYVFTKEIAEPKIPYNKFAE